VSSQLNILLKIQLKIKYKWKWKIKVMRTVNWRLSLTPAMTGNALKLLLSAIDPSRTRTYGRVKASSTGSFFASI
jgi:hypothetical protein